MPDDVVQGSNAECAGLIVVSPSVDAADLNFKLREIAVPTLVLEDSSFVYFNMTNGSAGIDYGTEASEQEIELIEDPALPTAHPISQLGFTQGDLLEVHGSGDLTQWGEPRRDGVTILSVDGDPAKATVFAYEQGNTMPGLLIAPERRVGGWLDVNTLGNPGTETDTILDRMLCWLSRNCPSDREIYTNDVEDVAGPATTYCAGDSIYINYTKTGQFLGVVPNIADPIYTREVDNSYDIGEFNSDGTLRMILQGTDWLETKAGGPFIDTSYLDDNDAGSLHMAIMRPEILATGEYDVRVHVPDPGYGPGDTVTADAEVTINHADGTTVAYLDQRTSTGYISVGTYRFEKGTDGTVIISNFNSKDRPDMHTLVDAVQFSPISLQPEGNVFTAQLSNSVGTFASFRELGSIMDTAAGTIAGVIPEDVATGTQYRVRVTSSLPSITGDLNDNGTITITGEPQKPGPISGPAVACQNQSVYTYRVNTVPGVDSYVWTRPLGTTFQGQPSSVTELEVAAPDTTVTIDFGTSTGGILKVRTKNQCETSNNVDGFSSLNISLFSNPPVAPTAIGGKDTVCQLDTVTYAATHPNPSVVQSWRWILPTGAAVLGPDTLGTITLEFTGSPEPSTEQIGAYAIDACGDEGDTLYRDILIDNTLAAPSTGPITMTDGTCSGEKIFSVTPVPGATNYAWTLPGGSILNGAGTNTLEVVFQDPVSGNVEVQVTSPCGTDPTPSSLAINITDTSNFDFELAGGQDTVEICGPLLLGIPGYASYTWNTGSSDSVIVASSSGTYWVIVGDENGCTGTDSVEIVSSNPAVPVARDTTVSLTACGAIDVEVFADGSEGAYKWYDSLTGGTLLKENTQSFLMSDISKDTSVFVSSTSYGNPGGSAYIFDHYNDLREAGWMDLEPYAGIINSSSTLTVEVQFITAWDGNLSYDRRSDFSSTDDIMILDRQGDGIDVRITPSGEVGFNWWDGSTFRTSYTSAGYNDSTWHHFAAVFDNGNVELYVDGVLDGTATWGASPLVHSTSNRFRLAGNDEAMNFLGGLDEIRIWKSARTQTEIVDNMETCLFGNEDRLAFYVNFEDTVHHYFTNGTIPPGDNCHIPAAIERISGDTLHIAPDGYNCRSNLDGLGTSIANNGGVHTTGGPATLACALCESGRDELTLTIDSVVADPLITRDYLICTPGSDLTVLAEGGGGVYRWYDVSSGGSPIDSGSSLFIPNINADTTVYVSSRQPANPSPSQYVYDDNDGSYEGKFVDFGDIPSNKSLINGKTKFTYENWFKSSYGGARTCMTCTRHDGLRVTMESDGRVRVMVHDGSVFQYLPSPSAYNDNLWHHLAFTFNAGEAKLYIDGNEVASATGWGSSLQYNGGGGDRFQVGGGANTYSRWYGGLDEVRMWDVVRSESEIQEYMDLCLLGNESGLTAYVNFDDDSRVGTGVADVVYELTRGIYLSSAFNTTLRLDGFDATDDGGFEGDGPILSCGVCESPRDTIEVVYDPASELNTNALASNTVCVGDSIDAPVSVCDQSIICDYVRAGAASLEFSSGDGDYVDIPNNMTSDLTGDYTFEAWIKTAKNDATIIGVNDNDGADNDIIWRVDGDVLEFFNTSGGNPTGSVTLNDNNWHHVAVAVDNSSNTIQMYVDGVADGSESHGHVLDGTTDEGIFIGTEMDGSGFTGAGNFFDGLMTEVRIWDDVRTATEIANNMNACIDAASETNLVAYFKMTDGSGSSTLTDVTSNNYDGSLVSFDVSTDWIDVRPTGYSCAGGTKYNYHIELSDASGSFASPTLVSDTAYEADIDLCTNLNDFIRFVFPDSFPSGSNYKVRVVAVAEDGSDSVVGNPTPTNMRTSVNMWTGAVNRTWQNDGNWTCGVPTKFENALIPSTANHPIVDGDSGAVYVHNIHLNQGASLTFLNGSETYVYGDVFADSAGSAVLTNGPHSLYMYGESGVEQDLYVRQRLFNLEIDNPDGVRVYHDMELLGDLNMVDGNLVLDEYDLDMCNGGGAIVGGGPASYIEQNAAKGSDGYIRMSVPVGTQLTYPIGVNGGTYTPAHLRNSGSAARCYEVRVFDNVYEHGMGAATRTFGDSIVDKTWEITPLPEAGASLDLTLQWNDADERANFAANRYIGYIAKNIHVGTSPWLHIPSSLGTVSGASEPYQATATGITTFSTFMVANVQVPLPVELLSFTAMNVEGNGQLSWITAEEEGLKGFDVLKSTDGEHFEQIAWVEAQGSSVTKKDYQLMDYNLTERSYYKLRLVDEDGSVEYSQVRAVDVEEKAGEFQLYPNPVHDNVVTLNYTGSMDFDEEVRLRITNSVGQHVATYEGTVFELQQRLNDDLSKLANAVYNLKFMREGEEQPQVVQLVVQKPMDN